jgi:hypothetical protein
MKQASLNVLFYVKRTKPLKNGTLPIYVRVTVNASRIEFATKMNIEERLWDPIRTCAKGSTIEARRINNQLDNIKSDFICHKNDIEMHDEILTIELLRDRYLGLDTRRKTILSIFKEHNEKCEALMNIDFAPGTVERYKTCYKHIENFILFKYKKNDVMLSEINSMFIDNFEYYLKTERKCCNNTVIKYVKNFKKIIKSICK